MSTEPSTDCTDCNSFTRRYFMRAGATAAVAAAGIGAGAGSAAAATDLTIEFVTVMRGPSVRNIARENSCGDIRRRTFVY